jgi:GT2 family glycosyltransferase
MNRPDDLRRCLSSIVQNSTQPDEIIVSDDSPDGHLTCMVVAAFPGVIYQEGPHRGLGPNRNACIRRASGSHIIFVDDDVCVSPEFFAVVQQLINSVDDQTIITGYELNHQGNQVRKVTPHNADFWGLQRVPVRDQYRAIVINATIFPAHVFQGLLFDENLRYGNDEIDVARHAIALGYSIIYRDDLYVHHYPSPTNREQYQSLIHASRLYTTLKAYWHYEKSLLKTVAYVLLAPLQLAGSAAKRGDLQGVWQTFHAVKLACQYLMASRKIAQE